MPQDASGKYRMNAQIARSPIGGAKKPVAAAKDVSAPADDDQALSVTISKNPDGTFHTSESSGDQNDFPDFDSAMGKAAECLGESAEPTADAGAPSSTADALGAMGQ